MIIPSGLASEAIVKESKFCVQTEFAHRPKPRVTTTISLNGEVVEKVETNWGKSPLTEDDKRDIEIFLKKQHQKVVEKIKQKDDRHGTGSDGDDGSYPVTEDAVFRVDQELSQTDGIRGWAFLLEGGEFLSHRISDREEKEQLRRVRDFSSWLSSNTDVGNFTGGFLDLQDGLSVFVPVRDHLLGIRLDSKADPKSVVAKIRALI
jgi:hypothetical protein